MADNFTDEHRDRPVVTAEGDRLGTVSEVSEDRATIESTDEDRGNLTDNVRDMLEWGDDESGEREIRNEDVDTYGDDEIRLRAP